MTTAEIGIFGGSGFYEFAAGATEVEVDTPFGTPSAPITVTEIEGRSVAFLPRHGRGHEIAPHRIPVKANMWALRGLGVRQVVGPCAVGSLRPDRHPEEFVVLDQLIDRTKGRDDTYWHEGRPHHVSFADPYCPEIRRLAVDAARAAGVTVHDGGTIVVIEGPRFATRAESAWNRKMGGDVVGMTQYPEAYVARELGMHYGGIALVTDYDVGVADDPEVEAVTQEQVFATMDRNIERVREVLTHLIPSLPEDPPGYPDAVGPLERFEG